MKISFITLLCVFVNFLTITAQNSQPSIIGEWCYRQEWQNNGQTNFCNWIYVFTADGNIECRKELGTINVDNGDLVVEIWGDQERISTWKDKPEAGISSVECFYSLQYDFNQTTKKINLNWHGEPRGILKVISFTHNKLTIDEDGEIITFTRRSNNGNLHFKY